MEGYKNSLEHLIEELARIEIRVRLQILKFRITGRGAPDEFSGFCITEEQIDSILTHGDGFETETPILNIDERIINYVFGSDQMDAGLAPFVQWADPDVSWPALVLPEGMKTRLEELIDGYSKSTRYEGLILYFQGTAGAGKRTAAEALCSKLGIRLLVVDAERLMNVDLGIQMAARLLFREALLQQAALYLDNFDSLLGEDAADNSANT